MVATESLRRLPVAQEVEAFFRFIAGELGDIATHCERTANVADAIASRLGVDEAERVVLRAASLLHDIGKVWVPKRILYKPARLTPDEFRTMAAHVSYAAVYLARFDGHERIARIVGQHHERFDGRGYPHRIPGPELDPLSRILSVADAFCAATEDRSYQIGLSPETARERIAIDSGRHFDPIVVDAFLAIDTTHLHPATAA